MKFECGYLVFISYGFINGKKIHIYSWRSLHAQACPVPFRVLFYLYFYRSMR